MTCPLCSQIAAERDEALEAVRQLKELAYGGKDEIARLSMLGLTPCEARMAAVLLRQDVAREQSIMDALYSDRAKGYPEDPKIIGVWAHKIRHKLAPLGIIVRTVWGLGYAMDADSKAKLRAAAGLDG